jgi:RNA polymerase-binding protein DksA
VKKAPAKAAPARKAAPVKVAVKKAPAKAAPAKKAAPVKTAVTKAPAKSAPAKAAAPAKKPTGAASAPNKAVAPAKKPAAATTTAAKKAAPAKVVATKPEAVKAVEPVVEVAALAPAPPAKAPTKAAAKKAAAVAAAALEALDDDTPAPPTRAELLAAAAAAQAKPAQPEVVPPKSGATVLAGERPWTKPELAKVRGSLEAQVRDLRGEITDAEENWAALQRDSGEGAGDDQADAGTKTFEREHEMSLAANSRDLLSQVERALQRLDDGSYPVCESCGNPIGKARLQAFPRATLCVSCKQREERR